MNRRSGGLPTFLRTPPFPHTNPNRVAIAVPAEDGGAVEGERGERLFAAIAKTRVGGNFWEETGPWADMPRAARGDDDAVAIAAILGRPIIVTAPGRFGSPSSGADRAAVAHHLLSQTRYRDPFDGTPISAERAVEILGDWRVLIEANRAVPVAMGMAWWKRRQMDTFLWSGKRPQYVRRDDTAIRIAARSGAGIAVWPSRLSTDLLDKAERAGVPIVRVEDGFIRSVGLGSGLHPPYSVAVDPLGIHYDPARPSELERLCETAEFPSDLLARAAALRRTIVTHGISKYGTVDGGALPSRDATRRLVLVTGQVSDDLSVLAGGNGIAGNAELLRRAREHEPDAEIWFRPHPDVDAGHRHGAIPDAEARRFADRVVRGGSMAEMLGTVDGLHVLTSLAGFEALLRGRDVTTHGTPFYAGWGLTTDLGAPTPRRVRRLSVDELLAVTLILYPRYVDPVTALPCQPETLVARFTAQAAPRLTWLHWLRSIQGRFTKARA